MRLTPLLVLSFTLISARPGLSQQIDLGTTRLVDLTHSFNAETIFWPTSPSTFQLQQLAHGQTEGGFFYSANAFSTPEHGGTHLDAPIHFAEGGQTTDKIPLGQLIGPAVVIDVSGKSASNPDYRLTHEDVLEFERAHGRIGPGTIVLLRTGWSARWPDRKRYLGDDTPNDASKLRFPSFGEDAARLLVEERSVKAMSDYEPTRVLSSWACDSADDTPLTCAATPAYIRPDT